MGSGFALALDTTGHIWRWGEETDGELGGDTGTTSTAISAPIGPSLADVVAIAAGGHHGLALQAEGSGGDTLYGWGENTSGQLGLGTTTDTSRAQAVPGITSAVAIAAGAQSSYVLSATGSVSGMGSDASGQLPGIAGGTEFPELLSAPVGGGTTVAIAASGQDFYQEEDQNGSLSLYGYGDDASGQLGQPTATSGVSDLGEDPASLSAGPTHLAALAEDGDADSLGDNAAGEAGNATVTSTDSFAAASGFSAAAEATSTSVTDYAYDGQGIRRTSSTAGQTTTFSYWGAGDEPELLSDGTNDYLYGPNGEVDEQVSLATGAPTYLVHDRLGSTRLITDASGNVVGIVTYDAYGNLTEHTGTATSPIGYAGGYTDPTGLVYLLHRYYDPETGEFLTVDPEVEETGQPSVYGGDDPSNQVDPAGLMTECSDAMMSPGSDAFQPGGCQIDTSTVEALQSLGISLSSVEDAPEFVEIGVNKGLCKGGVCWVYTPLLAFMGFPGRGRYPNLDAAEWIMFSNLYRDKPDPFLDGPYLTEQHWLEYWGSAGAPEGYDQSLEVYQNISNWNLGDAVEHIYELLHDAETLGLSSPSIIPSSYNAGWSQACSSA